jgi:alkylation response protein AidB-like acyl-CoA dehydrogenase
MRGHTPTAHQFGRQFRLPVDPAQAAEMQTQLQRLMTYHAADLANGKGSFGVETSMTKLFVTEAAKAIALECQTILGAYGYVKEVDTERYVRDALLLPIIGGSSAIQKNNIVNWTGLARA